MTLFHQLRTSFLALFARKSAVWHEGDQAYRDGKSEEANPYNERIYPMSHSEWRKGFYGMLLLVAIGLSQLTGCSGCRNDLKHLQSQWSGLDRTITLYGATGEPIRTWKTRATVEDKGGTCYFLDKDGKAVTVSGSFVIEEN